MKKMCGEDASTRVRGQPLGRRTGESADRDLATVRAETPAEVWKIWVASVLGFRLWGGRPLI